MIFSALTYAWVEIDASIHPVLLIDNIYTRLQWCVIYELVHISGLVDDFFLSTKNELKINEKKS